MMIMIWYGNRNTLRTYPLAIQDGWNLTWQNMTSFAWSSKSPCLIRRDSLLVLDVDWICCPCLLCQSVVPQITRDPVRQGSDARLWLDGHEGFNSAFLGVTCADNVFNVTTMSHDFPGKIGQTCPWLKSVKCILVVPNDCKKKKKSLQKILQSSVCPFQI